MFEIKERHQEKERLVVSLFGGVMSSKASRGPHYSTEGRKGVDLHDVQK